MTKTYYRLHCNLKRQPQLPFNAIVACMACCKAFRHCDCPPLAQETGLQRFWRACRTQVQEAYLHCWGCERYQDWDVLICDWSTTPSRRPELRTHLGPAEQHHLIACKASPEVEESKAAASCKGGSCLGAMRDGLVHASRGSG